MASRLCTCFKQDQVCVFVFRHGQPAVHVLQAKAGVCVCVFLCLGMASRLHTCFKLEQLWGGGGWGVKGGLRRGVRAGVWVKRGVGLCGHSLLCTVTQVGEGGVGVGGMVFVSKCPGVCVSREKGVATSPYVQILEWVKVE